MNVKQHPELGRRKLTDRNVPEKLQEENCESNQGEQGSNLKSQTRGAKRYSLEALRPPVRPARTLPPPAGKCSGRVSGVR